MTENNYKIWYKNNNDSVFVKGNFIKLTLADRFNLMAKNFHLFLRGIRKRLKKKLTLLNSRKISKIFSEIKSLLTE